MSNTVVSKDVRVDTTHTNFFPIVNLHKGKSVRLRFGKVEDWKSGDDLIEYLSVANTVYINDQDPIREKSKRSTLLNQLTDTYDCWYRGRFKSAADANLMLDTGVTHVVYQLGDITDDLLDQVDNSKIVVSFTLPKQRNKENDNKLFDTLKKVCEKVKYLILNLDDKYNSREVVETTTQIYDLFRKSDHLDDVKMGVNARNINSRGELQLLMGTGVDLHLGFPLHNDLLKLGEIYSLLLNDLLQCNYLNLPNNSLPWFLTTVQDRDGKIYQQYYTTKNTFDKTVERRYAVYWSREARTEYKMKEHKIRRIHFSADKCSLIFMIDPVEEDTDKKSMSLSQFVGYHTPLRGRVDLMERNVKELPISTGEDVERRLIKAVKDKSWSSAVQHLFDLVELNGEDTTDVLDQTLLQDAKSYNTILEDDKLDKYTFYSKVPFGSDEKLVVLTDKPYYAERILEHSGLNYTVVTLDNSKFPRDIVSVFRVSDKYNCVMVSDEYYAYDERDAEDFNAQNYHQLSMSLEFYYLFDQCEEVVEEDDQHIVKRVVYRADKSDGTYFLYYKNDYFKQMRFLVDNTDGDEVCCRNLPYIELCSAPSEIKIRINEKRQIAFLREGVVISDDEAMEHYKGKTVDEVKERVYNMYDGMKEKVAFLVDQVVKDDKLVLNYIQLV